jgi:hypothetical protein
VSGTAIWARDGPGLATTHQQTAASRPTRPTLHLPPGFDNLRNRGVCHQRETLFYISGKTERRARAVARPNLA